ncbi:MAG: alkaline phosphatase family protein [Deltaproteobacteria bacterium]|nr:alkaline phosphatase family protein [Deltaproteobacteria bacterium]
MFYERVIMILADGAREDVFRDLLAKGELPHIEKEIVGPGTLANGITTFPSTTGPAYFPFLTGCFPGTLNVPGIRWFDKEAYASAAKKMVKFRSYVGIETFLINSDMKPVPTLFELLPKSFNIFNSVTKGVTKKGNLTTLMRIWYWYYAHLTDRWEFVDKEALTKVLKAVEKDFEFLFVVLPGIDEYSHLAHPHHEKTFEQYRYLDTAVGQIAAKLKNQNKWEGTLVWIISDHGLSKTDTHFCVNTFMEKRGLPPFYYPKVFHRRGKKVANMVSGNGMTHLYFKNQDGWGGHATQKEIEKIDSKVLTDLVKEKAVDILMVRQSDGGVGIFSKRGEASLKKVGDKLEYRVRTNDPFGYTNLSGKWSGSEILEKTKDSDYPDAPWQIASLFQAARTGDVVLSATPGFDFRLQYEVPEHRGSHGSLHREHLATPIAVNVPLTQKVFRTADVFPTTLKLMGKEIPSAIDGESLV